MHQPLCPGFGQPVDPCSDHATWLPIDPADLPEIDHEEDAEDGDTLEISRDDCGEESACSR